MTIQKAVKEAVQAGRCITTPVFKGTSKIRPTNGPGNCILMRADGSDPSKYGWQPAADDLIRDDWIIVD